MIKLNVENILKEVLISDNGCMAHCKYAYWEKGDMCCDEQDKDGNCQNHSLYEIDYQKVSEDYELKEGDTP